MRVPYAALEGIHTADYVVIGAGFTGLSAAMRLAELNPKKTTVLLEACKVAEGPAGRNSGFMIDLPHVLTSSDYSGEESKDAAHIRLNRAGIDYAMQAQRTFNMPAEAIAQNGKVNGAITSKGLQHNNSYANYLKKMNEPFERLNASAMNAITGSDAYIDGIFTPGAAIIQPAMYIRAFADGVVSMNVQLYEQTPVSEIERQGVDWLVTTPKGQVSCEKIILAVNGHLESFGFFKRQLMHVHTYASMTEKLSEAQVKRLGGRSEWAITPADPLGTTVRRISGCGGDRLIIRNRATYDPLLRASTSWLKSIVRTHDQSFSDRFPMLADVSMAYRWGGRLCLSRNDVPVFGEVEPGLIAACCQTGLGTAKGTIAGKLAADFACGKTSELLKDISAGPAAKKLLREPFASIGATSYIRFGEWRAGKEL